MSLSLFLTHATLAVGLFFMMNFIGKNLLSKGYIQISLFVQEDDIPAFNFLFRAIAPIIYMTIVSAICYILKQPWVIKNIYWVTFYHLVIRFLFCFFTGKLMLLNMKMQIAYALTTIPLAYLVYSHVIVDEQFFFPKPQDLGNALWLAVLGFIYHVANSIKLSTEAQRSRKRNYLKKTYNKYKKIYNSKLLSITLDKEVQCLIYSILIYENFNRPALFRAVENILFYFGKANTLGIMQVTTDKHISDVESLEIGANKIKTAYQIALEKEDTQESSYFDKDFYYKYRATIEDFIKYNPGITLPKSDNVQIYSKSKARRAAIKDYNCDSDYIYEVMEIYDIVFEMFYHEND